MMNVALQDLTPDFVGDAAVWVHNTNCTCETAFDRVLDRAEATARLEDGQIPCFAAGTLVHTKEGLKPIEDICVGDWVLSYPED